MTVKRGKLIVAAVLAFLGLTLCADYSLAAPQRVLTIQASCPDIQSGVAFIITLTITNEREDSNINFDKVALGYINPDMTFSGPTEGVIAEANVKKGQTITRQVTYTVTTTQPPGTIIPILVGLYNKRFASDNTSFRGTIMLGAKVQ